MFALLHELMGSGVTKGGQSPAYSPLLLFLMKSGGIIGPLFLRGRGPWWVVWWQRGWGWGFLLASLPFSEVSYP